MFVTICKIVIINVIRYIMTVFSFSTMINMGRGGVETNEKPLSHKVFSSNSNLLSLNLRNLICYGLLH